VFAYEPGPELTPYVYGLALLMAGIGALTDYRTGHIPNWLTLPPIIIAPIAYGLAFGWDAFMGVSVGIIICGLVPVIMFYMNGMAGSSAPTSGFKQSCSRSWSAASIRSAGSRGMGSCSEPSATWR